CDAITRPTPPARMTSPRATGAIYDLPSFIQPRIAGSSDKYSTFTNASPGPGSGAGDLVDSKSPRFTIPLGPAINLNSRFFTVVTVCILAILGNPLCATHHSSPGNV